MKKLTAMIVVVALLLMLTACTPKQSVESDELETTETTTEAIALEEDSKSTTKDWEWTDYTEEKLVSPEGVKFAFSTLDGRYEYRYIIEYNDDRCLVMSGPSSIWLADNNGSLVCISNDQIVVDYTVAYDTIYWMNMDREVWAANWTEDDCTVELFCKDAIAVSPFTDEAEGAVVAPERANWSGYGGIPIYSPYGE